MKRRIVSLVMILAVLFSIPLAEAHAISKLKHFTAKIDSSPAVYSGPGKEYYRANNGKAQYGRSGVARIYGLAPNGWMMIGYELKTGDYRIGYVAPQYADMLYSVKGGDSGIPDLNLDSVPAWITRDCELTDDPVIHTNPIAELSKGTSVTYLATLGNWAYIETDCSIGLVRAFVRQEHVTTSDNTGGKPVNNPPLATWRTLYRQYLQKYGSDEWSMLRLIDLDFNHTPELLITTGRAHAGTQIMVLAIQNEKVKTSEFVIMEMDGNSEWEYPTDLLLFYNSDTMQNEWLIFDGYIMGDYESNNVNRLTFVNAQAEITELFKHEMTRRENSNTVSHVYYANGQVVSRDTYNKRISAFRSWIEPLDFKATVYDRMAGGKSVLSAYEKIAREYK